MENLPDYVYPVLVIALVLSLYTNVRLFMAKVLPRLSGKGGKRPAPDRQPGKGA